MTATPWFEDKWISFAAVAAESTGRGILNQDVRYHLAEADLRQHAAASLPTASENTGKYAWVTDLEVVAFSDGTNWRRLDTEAVI